MQGVIHLLLSIAVYFSNYCSGRRHSYRRIYGGAPVSIERFPWHVGLISSRYGYFCGGSIVSQYFVLSATHCVNDIKPDEVIYVKYGTSYRLQNSRLIRMAKAHIYPGTDPYYDIAVLELQYPIPFSSVAHPIRLKSTDTLGGAAAIVSGWGTKEDGALSPVLKATEVIVVDRERCRRSWGNLGNQITVDKLCAAYPKTGACPGDSGGALVVGQSQIGIASYVDSENCALKSSPDVYVNVAFFRNFINEKTRNSVQWSPV